MLLQLRDFISREKIVSTQQLMREFKLDLQALLPMLEWWIKKEVIGLCPQKTACKSSCASHCRGSVIEYYQYKG